MSILIFLISFAAHSTSLPPSTPHTVKAKCCGGDSGAVAGKKLSVYRVIPSGNQLKCEVTPLGECKFYPQAFTNWRFVASPASEGVAFKGWTYQYFSMSQGRAILNTAEGNPFDWTIPGDADPSKAIEVRPEYAIKSTHQTIAFVPDRSCPAIEAVNVSWSSGTPPTWSTEKPLTYQELVSASVPGVWYANFSKPRGITAYGLSVDFQRGTTCGRAFYTSGAPDGDSYLLDENHEPRESWLKFKVTPNSLVLKLECECGPPVPTSSPTRPPEPSTTPSFSPTPSSSPTITPDDLPRARSEANAMTHPTPNQTPRP